MHLPAAFKDCLESAAAIIVQGNAWYVCDIVGERVFGHAMLTLPEKTLPVLKKLAQQEENWLLRTLGVATHYAVKNKLDKAYAEKLFVLLLSLANTTDFHTKKGIGWGAKTIAKFHPSIISVYKENIEGPEVKQWFRTKVKIGLGRSAKYATRD